MSHNQSSSNDNEFDMIAVATVAAQLALDIRGPPPQDMMRFVVPRRTNRSIEPSPIDRECMRLWNGSQTKRDFDAFNPAVDTDASEGLKAVCRVCIRVFWTTPHEMLSFENKLRYRPTPPPGMEASHVVFTPKFSRLFAELAVHPCWQGLPYLLIMAIQYTVKVRFDSRTPWPFGVAAELIECPALKALDELFYEHEDGPMATASVHEMHIQAREAQTKAPPSEFSDFLVYLGQIARMSPSSDYSQTYLGHPTLPVTTKDLQILTTAVTHFHWDNVDWTETPGKVFEAFERKGGLSDDQYPRNNRELKTFVRRCLVGNYQKVAMWRDMVGVTNPPGETPSDNEVLAGDESEFESGFESD
ncbi:hypothetical protein FOBRF1_011934 [Fusarium oxysporum]